MAVPIRGFPFGTVSERQQPAVGAAGVAGTDIATFALAYQMMRDAKTLPTTPKVFTAGDTLLLVSNAKRLTPLYVRVRAALENSVSIPYLYLGTDSSQTEAHAALDRISNGGQLDILLYPGQELWGGYVGDAASKGTTYISVSTFDDAVLQAKRATGQAV